MTVRPRATEIPELVQRLGSRDLDRVDAARARLSIIGARAVEALVEALEGDNNRIRAHAMPLLALIRDPRGREPLAAMLLDEEPRLRELAARCLARFPSPESVAALERFLNREKRPEVRMMGVRALVELYASGLEPAVRRVVEILFDTDEDERVRIAALALLPHLKASERRGLIRRLKQDRCTEVVRRATELEATDDPGAPADAASLRNQLAGLAAEDYPVWNEAVHRLAAAGATAVHPLVQEMQRRAHDPEYCTRAGMVLKAMGPRRARGLAEALDEMEEPLPLQVLVEVVGALGEKALIYRLKDLLERLARRTAPEAADGFDPLQRVRAKAHLELARIGSRVSIQDLREALADPGRRVELEMLAAVEIIGKKDELPDLLRAWCREDRFMRERIASVVRTIMKRERIRRNNPLFQTLGNDLRRALEAILPAPALRTAPRRSRAR
jgi:HEAT repeat protein